MAQQQNTYQVEMISKLISRKDLRMYFLLKE